MLQQFSTQVGPALPLSAVFIAGIALCIVTANVACPNLLAAAVSFPFTIQLSGLSYFLLEVLAVGIEWRAQIRANPILL